jgi:hypothetical protein
VISLFTISKFSHGRIALSTYFNPHPIHWYGRLIARSNREDDTYADLETDEWDCPECGFHIQAGTPVFIVVKKSIHSNYIFQE